MEAWRQWLLGRKSTLPWSREKTHYEPKIPLTPTGLLMEGRYTQNPRHSECYEDVTSACTRVGILGKGAVDTSPRKHVVVPPFCKKPPAASGTFEGLEPNASDGVERHPTKRRYKRWRCSFESPYGQNSE